MISQKSIREIMDTARIEEVVGEYVNLKRAGSNLKGLCPFHGEKTPSFSVSPSKNLFKCFGCGIGGDAVRFLME
ncbi:MAG: CHC2 zinc finger domain-containing protein, partial [Cyanobacteria bacterium J06649_11]